MEYNCPETGAAISQQGLILESFIMIGWELVDFL